MLNFVVAVEHYFFESLLIFTGADDNISLPSMDSEMMRDLIGKDEDSNLLPDDIPSDEEFDDYVFGECIFIQVSSFNLFLTYIACFFFAFFCYFKYR